MKRAREDTAETVGLVVLDMAGTCVDYGSRAPAAMFVKLFGNHGVTVTDSQAREPMGLNKRAHIAALLDMPAVAEQWIKSKGSKASDADIDSLYAEFIPLQLGRLPEHCDMIPGVAETITALSARGIKVAATTGYNQEMMEIVLSQTKDVFKPDITYCADAVSKGRPAPWLIFKCMEAAGVHPPRRVVKVGDTIADVSSGVNAGCWSVGVVRTGNMLGLSREDADALPVDELASRLAAGSTAMTNVGAHYVCDGVADLLSIIDKINESLSQGKGPSA